MDPVSKVLIVPAHQHMKTVAKQLLELAEDKVADVTYVGWPDPGFWVPESLYEAWEATLVRDESGDPVLLVAPVEPHVFTEPPTGPEVEMAVAREVQEESVPAKRKPGRPKKIQGGQ
jgi:hypothetical protein